MSATVAGSTVAPSTAPARSSSSVAGPARRSRASTTCCNDSGHPARPRPARAASPRRTGCARGCGARSSRPARAARRGGDPGHGGVGQRADVEPVGDVGQRRPARPHPPRPGWCRAPAAACRQVSGQVVQQLDGGQAGVVQIVEQQQRRPVGRSPRRTCRRPRRRAAARTRRCPARRRRRPSRPPAPGAARPARARAVRPARAAARRLSGAAKRVDERLQEERALAGVAAALQHQPAGACRDPAARRPAASCRCRPRRPAARTAGRPAQAADHASVRRRDLGRPADQVPTGAGPGRVGPARAGRGRVLAQDRPGGSRGSAGRGRRPARWRGPARRRS